MSDRLTELRRQRALVQEQLAWLDREIAALEPAARPADPASLPPSLTPVASPALSAPPAAAVPLWPAPGPTAASVRPTGPTFPAATAATAASSGQSVSADAILSEYRVPPDALKSDIRKGCLLYFVAAVGLLALGVVTLYFVFRAR